MRLVALLPLALLAFACGGSTASQDACPANGVSVSPGAACSVAGQQCATVITYGCPQDPGSQSVTCTCTDGSWQCPAVEEPQSCIVPDPCPAPSSIVQGGACTGTGQAPACPSDIPIFTCDGSPAGNVTCSCISGYWDCPEPGYACPAEAGPPCPSPDQTFQGAGCDTYGMTCQGDPQSCDGTTVYDTLQCASGVWYVVASTYCDVNDGGVDAQVGPDAGQGF
jgi:hypothetical protein